MMYTVFTIMAHFHDIQFDAPHERVHSTGIFWTMMIFILKSSFLASTYAIVERKRKEDWVIQETYKQSYTATIEMLNKSPYSTLLANQKG